MKRPVQLSIREHADDPRWSLVWRIVASRSLRRSTLLVNFLLFICDRCLEGKAAEINERQIGIHVFGRGEDYNSNDDNIDRNYARILRKRMGAYFATEGRYESILVGIPRGGYVPVFSDRTAVAGGA